MDQSNLYSGLRWRMVRLRALDRDNHRCVVSRLLGDEYGPCSDGPLHVHHLRPVSAGGAAYDVGNTICLCSSHHPRVEALRRHLLSDPRTPRCHHQHRTEESRRLCEMRLARQRQVAA